MAEQALHSRAPYRSSRAGECGGFARGPGGRGSGPCSAEAFPDRAHRGKPLLPGGECPHPGGDGSPRGRCSYRLTTDVRDIHVPVTVQALLASRIDRLQPEEKRLLQAASVIGRDIPVALLGEISETANEELRARLVRLEAAGLLYEGRLFPEHGYKFKHALTHEVAQASLLQERRRGLHRSILEVLKRRPAAQTGEVEVMARHAVGAEAW